MSVRGLTPVFKWGFGLRRSKFLVPLMNTNILVSGEEAIVDSTNSLPENMFNTLREKEELDEANVKSKSETPENTQEETIKKNIESKVVVDLNSLNEVLKESQNDNDIPFKRSNTSQTKKEILEEFKKGFKENLTKTNNSSKKDSESQTDLPSSTSTKNDAVDDSPKMKFDIRSSTSFCITSNGPLSSSDSNTSSSQAGPSYSHSRNNSTASSSSIKLSELSDEKIIEQIELGKIQSYRLEHELGDCTRAVDIRRKLLERNLKFKNDQNLNLGELPFTDYDFSKVMGQCCENVIGYIQVPVGIAGPLLINGDYFQIPLATTEGALVASTHRGCKAISLSGGATAKVLTNGMTRAPVVSLKDLEQSSNLKKWLENSENFQEISSIFNSTTRFGRLLSVKTSLVGKYAYLRFKCFTGDAMGMNIVSKGVELVLTHLQTIFPDMTIISLSGNYCTDKKPSSLNWTEGRGRSVVAEATIKKEIVSEILKTTVEALVQLNISKNLVGSAMAGSVGGFNAHTANIVTAIFLATGQDVAQNVESSNCLTFMESTNDGDLYISVTMPSIEVGTVGGGTFLPAQSSCLDILNVKGASKSPNQPGDNSDKLAKIVCASVLAGELSLMSALSAGHLMKSHLKLNRKA